jgi:pimeloyl-ACP methyl ester carboxylesterase
MRLATSSQGSGRPLVLVHAFPLSSAMWADQRDGLSDVATVITPDLRGFGQTPLGDDDPSIDLLAADLAETLADLDLRGVVLGGLSLGGYVLLAALRRPDVQERLSGIVLMDTKASADAPQAAANRRRIADEVLARGTGVLIDEVLPNLLGRTTFDSRPLVVRRVTAQIEAAAPASVAWMQRAMATRRDSLDVLSGSSLPALIVVGEQDAITPETHAHDMAAELTDVRLQRLAGAGHLSAMESPEDVNAALRRFLSELDA